jgi:ribosome biogenesis GTPase A|tara:strand:+ start:806 stop:1036 length:231 start_codon:yes stop_codon:yes gene_type:complete
MEEEKEVEEDEVDNGQEKVMTVLFKYAKKFMEKKDQETINVGVVGYPNVGKSSVINVLKNKAVVASGSHPFVTRSI